MIRRVCYGIVLGVIFLSILPLATGKSAKLVTTWRKPGYLPANKPYRVLALGLSEKTSIRADFEDALAAQLATAGVESIPGNTILLRPEGATFDLQYLKTQVRENKIVAIVVSRLIKVDNTATYMHGTPYIAPFPYYRTFYGYYGAVYPVVYSPGYLKEEKKVRIETNLYLASSGEGELVWTCMTDSFNPSDVDKAIGRLVKLVVQQMQSEGVL